MSAEHTPPIDEWSDPVTFLENRLVSLDGLIENLQEDRRSIAQQVAFYREKEKIKARSER